MNKKVFSLLALLFLSFLLNVANNDFPPEYHGDEPKKLRYLAENLQDFKHPILLLQIPRLVKAVLPVDDLTFLARTLNALYGVGIVLATYLIARRFLKGYWPLVAAAIAAFSPIICIHAHYIKEDILFTFGLLMTFWAALRYSESKSLKDCLIMTFFLGLTLSTKYIGWIFLPLALLLIALTEKERRLKRISIALGGSVALFFLINYPLFTNFSLFQEMFSRELFHSLNGHNHRGILVPVYPQEYWFGFHYLYSLIPGLTLFFTLAATVIILMRLKSWSSLGRPEKLLLLCPLIFYFVTESSPLKVFPNVMRYMIPVAPFLAIFAVELWQRTAQKWRLAHLAFLVAFGYMVWDSGHLVYYLNKDTREEAKEWMVAHKGEFEGDQYAGSVRGQPCVSTFDFREAETRGVHYLMASSFFYDRIAFTAKLDRKVPQIVRSQKIYEALFSKPYKEIKPAYKTFAFSNPTIRIIPIKDHLEQLIIVSTAE